MIPNAAGRQSGLGRVLEPKIGGKVMDRLQGKVIIVTGGANGIGRAYCEGLAQEGARVVVADIDAQGAASAAAELAEAGHESLAVATDVSREADAKNLARATLERFGQIDGLVNNAAIFQRPAMQRGPIEELSVEEWDRMMAVNLRGIFLCSRAVVPAMKEQQRGKIVNISSGTVSRGSPGLLHYVTSKAGVIGFTRTLARELGDYNINVNVVAPGLTISMDEDDLEESGAEHRLARIQTRSIKRAEVPEDLVGPVVFLCSPDSDFITGQTVVVDGGVWMH